MSPAYFHNRLTFGEAQDYLIGLQRRYHDGWRQARLVADVVCQLLSGKATEIEFPFDKESSEGQEDVLTEEDIQHLKELAKEGRKT